VVKAQIHAGGRGKAGGVKVVKSIDEVKKEAQRLLGSTLITHQTGPQGKEVHRLLIEEGAAIAREIYFSLLVDRETARVAVVASTEGGMDIEKVAHDTPEKITSFSIDPATNVCPFHVRLLAKALNLDNGQQKQMRRAPDQALQGLHREGHEPAGSESADRDQGRRSGLPRRQSELRRQRALPASRLVELRDITEEDDKEIEASKYDLNYIALDGSIGCMVNGAGLAMATMDIIKLYGAAPANFLDVGGSATKEKVAAAFKIITSDPSVKESW
jgi:succinyl-CoA synthetase beta subunit